MFKCKGSFAFYEGAKERVHQARSYVKIVIYDIIAVRDKKSLIFLSFGSRLLL